MQVIPGIFAFVVAAAGWFYLLYSKSASNLAPLEDVQSNQLRVRLRRVGGAAMVILGAAFAVGYYGAEIDRPGPVFAFSWLIVFITMITILALALADIRLTRQLRKRRNEAMRKLSDLDTK